MVTTKKSFSILLLIVYLLLGIGCTGLPFRQSQANVSNDQTSDNYQYVEKPMADSNSTSPIGNIIENDNSSPSPNEMILGTWRYFAEGSGPVILSFIKGGIGEMFVLWAVDDNNISVAIRHFTYHINNNMLMIKVEDEDEETCDFEINENIITIIDSYDSKIELERVSNSELSTTEIEKELSDATCEFMYNNAHNAILEQYYEDAFEVCYKLDENFRDRSAKAIELYGKLLDELYETADGAMSNEEYADAYDIYNKLSELGFKDSPEKAKEAYYMCAVSLVDVPEYSDADAWWAFHIFEELGPYRDSKDWIAALKDNAPQIRLKYAEKGDYVTFGVYEQDGDYYNGKEDIEWIVLDRQGDSILLISKYVLFSAQLNYDYGIDTTWENSILRNQLNSEMLYDSFSRFEQYCIMSSKVPTSYNVNNGLNSGSDTSDKLFILSWEEIEQYMPTNYQRVASSPLSPRDYKYWWVRTPGREAYGKFVTDDFWNPHSEYSNDRPFYMFVDKEGQLQEEAYSYTLSDSEVGSVRNKLGVRPAMWVDTSVIWGIGVNDASLTQGTKTNDIHNVQIGDIILFGAYEQDNNTANGWEDIEWLVLAMEDDKIFLISKCALDCQQYNTEFADVTWETCSLRKWLNDTFFNNAFSTDEQHLIQNTTVTADKNPLYNTSSGNNTTDNVFILSIAEVKKYFSSDKARQCIATAYAKTQGVSTSDNGNCLWWLRSPGDDEMWAAVVSNSGSVYDDGCSVLKGDIAVRPALWITLGS